MDPIRRSLPAAAGQRRLGWAVAASVSEGMRFHSLTLAATSEMKKMEGNWHRSGLVKCPGAFSADVCASDVGDLDDRTGRAPRLAIEKTSGQANMAIIGTLDRVSTMDPFVRRGFSPALLRIHSKSRGTYRPQFKFAVERAGGCDAGFRSRTG